MNTVYLLTSTDEGLQHAHVDVEALLSRIRTRLEDLGVGESLIITRVAVADADLADLPAA